MGGRASQPLLSHLGSYRNVTLNVGAVEGVGGS